MFRNLKQKLGESLANSPARNLLSVDQEKQVSVLITLDPAYTYVYKNA